MELPEDAVERVLEHWPVARLATVDADGRPHQVPIVFARIAERIWSPVDGKPKRGGELARVRHIRASPDVSLLLDDYAEDWSRLWWLRVDAVASVVEPRDPRADARVSAAVDALQRKYPQYDSVPVLRDPPTLLSLEIGRVQSWCASPEALPRA